MIRAVFFDFYSVWTPDKFGYYLAYAELMGPAMFKEIYDAIQKYYSGDMTLDDLTGTIRYKLGSKDIDQSTFKLNSNSISPEIANFMMTLHGHFVKVGVLANLGQQEYDLLKDFNDKNPIIEIVASPLSLSLKMPLLTQEVFSKAFESIGETADTCLYISGNPYHLAFAKVIGLQILHFEGLQHLEANLEQILSQDITS
jgi:hypothetical protein